MQLLTTLRRHWFLIICSGVCAALLVNFALTEGIMSGGAPYEDWDEIMAYNQATPLSLKARFENTTYGSVEEFKFRIAKFIYRHFDPIGRTVSPLRWSNNVLSSYRRPSVRSESYIPAPYQLEAVFESNHYRFDATYSRGILDRRPFFIARYINLIGAMVLWATLCCFWLARFRHHALFLIAPFLWFTLSEGYNRYAFLALPNGWNALFAIMVFVALMDVIERRRPLGLYISSALVGLGVNTKVDFIVLGAPIIATWVLGDFERGHPFGMRLRAAVVCLLSFLGVLVLTNPRLLYATPLVISEQFRLLHSVSAGSPNVSYNWVQLVNAFLTKSLGAPWNVAKLHSLSAAAGLGFCLLFPLSVVFSSELDTAKKRAILLILTTFYLFLWLVPLFRADHAYERYFLSGIGVAMVSIGYACRYFWKKHSMVGRSLGLLMLCLCVVFYVARAKQLALYDDWTRANLAECGLDWRWSRNQAVVKMIRLIEGGNYPKQVIIDQHSYTDVRAFLERGISVTLINVFNYKDQIERLKATAEPILGLYVPGEGKGSLDWMGKWNAEEQSLYDDYLRYLSTFETLEKVAGKPMFLLDWAPVDWHDAVVIFTTKRQ
jgi:hypothetical protein